MPIGENKTSEPAPIIVFAYNRPVHLYRTLSALKNNFLADCSTLYIFIDGVKEGVSEDTILKHKEVKDIASSERWCKEVQIIEAAINRGLANSITEGVSFVMNKHQKAIILEDDMVTAKGFLSYMNDALLVYENDESVMSISGYAFPIKNLPETYFIRGADCWGWASWKRAWDLYEKDGSKLLEEINKRNLEYEFDFEGSYPFLQMLKDQISGKNDSWAIRWFASAFLKEKLSLYPCVSLVQNIGFDGSGTHSDNNAQFHVNLSDRMIQIQRLPIIENRESFLKFKKYFILIETKTQVNWKNFIRKYLRFIFK